jgi:hypothetical protein
VRVYGWLQFEWLVNVSGADALIPSPGTPPPWGEYGMAAVDVSARGVRVHYNVCR